VLKEEEKIKRKTCPLFFVKMALIRQLILFLVLTQDLVEWSTSHPKRLQMSHGVNVNEHQTGAKQTLIAPQFIKPFVKSNKNDAADAEAIYEAVQRPTMRFVPAKNLET